MLVSLRARSVAECSEWESMWRPLCQCWRFGGDLRSWEPLMMFRHPCRLLPIFGPWVTLLVGAQLVEHWRLVARWTGKRLGRRLLRTLILREHCNGVRCYSVNRRRADANYLNVFADFAASFSSFSLFSFCAGGVPVRLDAPESSF